jgi:hypothetical protein
VTSPPVDPRSPAQRALMLSLANARVTDTDQFRFECNGETPIIRLARIIGEPTPKEVALLAQVLAVKNEREWKKWTGGFRETYIARAQLILSFLATLAVGKPS